MFVVDDGLAVTVLVRGVPPLAYRTSGTVAGSGAGLRSCFPGRAKLGRGE